MNGSYVQKYLEDRDEKVHVTTFNLTTLGYLLTFKYGIEEEEREVLITCKKDIEGLLRRLKGE